MLLLMAIVASGASVLAQTGTITGTITDSETGDPLIGATVIVVGTYKGTVADINGQYNLTGLKPGDYSLKFTYIGFNEKVYNGIRIKAGQTETISITLTELSKTLNEVVVVGGEAMVDLEAAQSSVKLTSADIKEMNATEVQDLVAMQAGVSQSPDGLQIRGGRVYETQYVVEGISASDPLAGTGFGVNVGSQAVSSLNVITGGADVEYGDGTSGVVVTQIKEGGDRLQLTGNWQRDNLGFNPHGATAWNTDIFNLSVGGPLPNLKNKAGFFVSVGGNLTDTYYGYRANQLRSSILPNQGTNLFAMRQNNNYNNTIKLNYKLSPSSKISITNQHSILVGQNDRALQIIGSDEIMRPGLQYGFAQNLDNATTYTHRSNLTAINYQKNFGELWGLRLSAGRMFSRMRADANGEPFRDSTIAEVYDARSIITDPINVYYPPDNPNVVQVLPGDGFINNGGRTSVWHDHWIEEYTLKYKLLRFTKKKIHAFTFGQEHKFQDLFWVDVSKPWVGAPVRLADGTYTPSNRIGVSNEIWAVKPQTGGLFVQDEIRYKGIIAFVGLRYNYWAPGKFADDRVNDPESPIPQNLRDDYKNETTEMFGMRWKSRLLPRLRVSFPVTENNVLYFSYGHNMRLAHPRFLYSGLDQQYLDNSTLSRLGNPNLNPEVSVNYELGIKSKITRDLGLTFTTFINDKFDYIVNRIIYVRDITGQNVEKSFSYNQDYARIMGAELGINYRIGKAFRVMFNASFQQAKGKSNTAAESLLRIKEDPNINTTQEQYLAWDRPFDFKSAVIFTPDTTWQLFGMPLNNFRAFLSATWKSGLRYTPTVFSGRYEDGTNRPIYQTDPTRPNAEIGSNWFWVDLKISRDFKLSKNAAISLSVEVKNLFNNKNAQIVNPVTGRGYEPGDPLLYSQRDPQYPNPEARGLPPTNPARYLQPTQVLYGISFSF